jgi:hypothetical protein
VRGDEGLDLGQCRALVLASLRHNLRRSGRSLGLASGHQASGIITIVSVQLLIGGILSFPLWVGVDVFPIAVLHFTYAMLSVAALLLLDAQTLVVAPADYDLVAPRPVSTSTAFAARVTTILLFVLVVALAQGLPVLAAYFAAGGWHPLRGASGLLALVSVTLTTAATVIALHGLVLRHVPPARLRVGLTTLQLTASMSLYVLLVLLPGAVGRAYLVGPIAERPAWLWVLPSAWAAQLVEPGARTAWPVLVALVLPMATLWAASRWLAIDHAALASGMPGDEARAHRVSPPFRTPEGRAIALLVRAQFRHDMRFRLGVLAILPLTIVYLLIGFTEEDIARDAHGHPAMVYIAVMLFPLLLRSAFARSDSYRAAWVFHATPVSAGRLLLGQRTVLVAWFLAPYVAAIGALLLYLLPTPAEALLTVVVVSLATHALLLVSFLVDPVLPFSCPPQVGANTRSMLISLVPAMLLGQFLPGILGQLATAPWQAAGAVSGLLGLNAALGVALRRRVDRLASQAEFSE